MLLCLRPGSKGVWNGLDTLLGLYCPRRGWDWGAPSFAAPPVVGVLLGAVLGVALILAGEFWVRYPRRHFPQRRGLVGALSVAVLVAEGPGLGALCGPSLPMAGNLLGVISEASLPMAGDWLGALCVGCSAYSQERVWDIIEGGRPVAVVWGQVVCYGGAALPGREWAGCAIGFALLAVGDTFGELSGATLPR